MMKRNHTRLCASAAIAAALALSTSPLLAQVAPDPTIVGPAPVPVLPEPLPPTAEQPTIVVPPELEAAPTTTTTTTVESPATPTMRTTTTTRTTRTATPAAPPPARARVTAPAEPAPVAADETVAPVAAPLPEAAVEPVAAEPVADAAPVVDDSAPGSNNAVLFGLMVLAAIAAIVLAIWGFVAIGRRRPVDRKAAAIVERPVVAPPAPQPEAIASRPVVAESAPIPAPSVSPIRTVSPAPSMAHTGAAVPLPRTIPESFEERSALIDRMVAAKPDRANPFRSPIQRRHRAKLILQSLGADFSDRDPWIDLSQYPQNWPELAARKHAAA
jgi:hypothetical protein